MRSTSLLGFGLLSLGLLACRSDGGGTTGDDDDTHPDTPAKTKIQDVQNDAMPAGTPVALDGVVVTAIDNFGAKQGDFWIQEPEGGPFSGVHVFGAPASDVAMLKVGDVVSIAGAVKDEFALTSDTSGRTVTELSKADGGAIAVTKTGSGTPLDPMVVDALAIGKMGTQAERDAEWEKWEGVLITVSNISALNAPACVGTACSDATLQNFDITGQAVAESSMAAFPAGITSGMCLGQITGVVDYFFDYLVLPRSTDEVTLTGGRCAIENTAATCSDGMDNDGNGFTDCDDNACIVGASACRATSTIPAVQAALPATAVELDNVFVTAIGFSKKSFWVSTDPTAAANNGIFVFRSASSAVLPPEVVVGAKVTVIGKVTEFNNDANGDTLTEISGLSVVASADAAVPPVPVPNQSVATLLQAANGEPMESVLVELKNVKVKTKADSTKGNVAILTQGGMDFEADDDIFRFVDGEGDCYQSIIGIWSYLTFDNVYGFLPLAKGTGTGSCN